MKQWKKRDTDECPHCGSQGEDNIHVLRCASVTAIETWDRCIIDFTDYLNKMRVTAQTATAIIEHMTAWRDQCTSTRTVSYNSTLQAAIEEQNTIGWDNFIMGRISRKWRMVFRQMYERMTHKQLTSSLLIKQLYNICFRMWDARNKVLHDPSIIHRIHGEKEINYRIRVQMEMGNELLIPNDYHLTNTTIDKLLKRSLKYKKQWLQTIEAARSCKMPSSSSSYNYSRNILRKFLHPSTVTRPTNSTPT